jgi:hypothetical protein
MLALGGLFVAGSIVLVVILTPIFRAPDRPAWTMAPLVAESVSIGIVSMAALGMAFAGAGVSEMVQHGLDLIRLGVLLLVVLGVGLIGRQIAARASPKAPAR